MTSSPRREQVYNAVNTVHAYREGNGRTPREWVSDLARAAGYELDWPHVHGLTDDIASQPEQPPNLEDRHRVAPIHARVISA